MIMLTWIICVAFVLPKVCVCQTSKVYNLIYQDFDVESYDKCVRLMNGTHQIGCQSSTQGNSGILYHVNNLTLLNKFLSITERNKYTLLLEAGFVNRNLIVQLKQKELVQGLIVYEADSFREPEISPDLSCPGNRFGLYNQSSPYTDCKHQTQLWNPYGNGLTEENIPFPIFYMLSKSGRDSLINCYNRYNVPETYPLCAVQMKSRMFGAVDSVTCVRRTALQSTLTPAAYCDAMGGHNVVVSLKPFSSNVANNVKSIILVTAALDSRSFMSSSTAPGGNLATGFITLLGVAKALGQLTMSQKNALSKNIVFILFDGEAFDNIGSTRMVYDMQNGNFPVVVDHTKVQPPPLTLDHISNIVELSQLGYMNNKMWAHYDPVSASGQSKDKIKDMIEKLQNVSGSILVSNQSAGIGLIPSSLQSILKHRDIPGIVLADFDQHFTNTKFFSRYDTLKNLVGVEFNENTTDGEVLQSLQPLAQNLSAAATATAKMLYNMANVGLNSATNVSVDAGSMSQLLFCFLYDSNCTLFHEHLLVGSSVTLPSTAFKRFVSVYNDAAVDQYAALSAHLLSSFTGEVLVNATSCQKTADNQTVSYFNFIGKTNGSVSANVCVRSSSFNTKAIAPPFETSDLSNNIEVYGLWTESRWSGTSFKLRMFLIQEEVNQGLVLLAGLLVLLVSFATVYVIQDKSTILFSPDNAL